MRQRFPRVGTVRRIAAVLMDRADQRRGRVPADGTLVRVIQPYGCPRNGTMGMGYVEHAETGEFIGLVCAATLEVA